jgi:hypothetical protein
MKAYSLRILLASAVSLCSFLPIASADPMPSYTWISKIPKKSESCFYSGYCLSIKIDPAWVKKCLSGDGDDVSVEIYYLNSKGKFLGNGIDPVGKKIKGELVHYPSANKSVFDSRGSERPISFSKAVVNNITCVWY